MLLRFGFFFFWLGRDGLLWRYGGSLGFVCLQLVSLVCMFNWSMVVACGFLLGWFCLLVEVIL